jgi:hypothetical protein
MTRYLYATGFALVVATSAAAQPAPVLGKTVQVEFTGREPRNQAGFQIAYDLPIQQGDRFRVQMDPVGGVKMTLLAQAWRTAVVHHESSTSGPRIDWTVREGLPGRSARITIHSVDVGSVNLRITRLMADGTEYPAAGTPATPGTPPTPAAGPGVDERLRRLEAENAEIRRQLAEILRRLDAKK